MKVITKYLMMITMMVMCINFSSCNNGDDPEPPEPEFTLKGTTWSFTEKFEEKEDGEVVKFEYEYVLDFASRDVTFTENVKATYKNESQSYSNHYDYTYTHSGNLVIMKPVEANLYNLEGTIISDIKMKVVNSDGDEIGTFYLED
ncbi:MAG: hypothetical protein IJE78_09665 [Bacteroidaceae bacterium]|nr:hypothetical protein [Bacteroidaceae bacterium]